MVIPCFSAGGAPRPRSGRRRRAVGLGREPETVGEERHRMVEADQRDQLQDLLDAERCREPFPELVGDRRRVVQLVDQPDQQPFFLAPGRIVRAAAQGGPDLRRRQGDPLGDEFRRRGTLSGRYGLTGWKDGPAMMPPWWTGSGGASLERSRSW